MNADSWQIFYQGELQAVYALCVIPIAFLAYRLVAPPDASRAVVPIATRFVAVLTLIFAIETIIDPFATGPLLEHTALKDTIGSSLIPFVFVFLGGRSRPLPRIRRSGVCFRGGFFTGGFVGVGFFLGGGGDAALLTSQSSRPGTGVPIFLNPMGLLK